ncbi:hypothetical protein BGZ54_008939 [Gamsiella multidivaricata]|nr:hypothetical protein BGZ54_008939 [Gamsiella multidivaricata]
MSTSTVSSIPSSATSPTSSSIAVPSPVTTPLPDTKGDTVLFGRPAVIAGYNLTTGILVNGAFFLIFSIVIVIATVKRAQFRRQFRRDIEKFGSVEAGRTSPGGKGGKGSPAIEKKSEKHSGDALSKQTSTSKQRLMDDIGPGGMQNTHIADANRSAPTYENRSEEHRQGPRGGAGVRFGESERYVPAGGRTGQQLPRRNNSGRLPERSNSERSNSERNAHAQQGRGERRDIADPLARYQDEPQDRTDYSLPPLTASTIDNSYKPARVIQAYEDYNTPQAPRPTYQQQLLSQQQALSQPRPLQPVKRSNSNRTPVARSESSSSSSMPVGLPPSARAIERANSRPRITTQGLADLSGSSLSSHSGSSLGSYANSPADRYGRSGSRGGSPVVPIEMDAYPTPIARSNSARLPTQMRVGGGGQAYDGSYA